MGDVNPTTLRTALRRTAPSARGVRRRGRSHRGSDPLNSCLWSQLRESAVEELNSGRAPVGSTPCFLTSTHTQLKTPGNTDHGPDCVATVLTVAQASRPWQSISITADCFSAVQHREGVNNLTIDYYQLGSGLVHSTQFLNHVDSGAWLSRKTGPRSPENNTTTIAATTSTTKLGIQQKKRSRISVWWCHVQ